MWREATPVAPDRKEALQKAQSEPPPPLSEILAVKKTNLRHSYNRLLKRSENGRAGWIETANAKKYPEGRSWNRCHHLIVIPKTLCVKLEYKD